MPFIADLHIHSRFSMATSKALSVPHLSAWAARKGINVLGSGDFTHPGWRAELAESLEYDEESGLYRPKAALLQDSGPAPYFCLQAEISSIYKRDGKVRKVHNLLYAPTLEAAEKISRRLALAGNIESDGRPILGLDSRDLLEIVLEASPEAALIPAHIWTPWFALFGSKSGFDRIEDCYGDLTGHIFALETGLSSDPPMNRCLSALDNYALVSNSDAHSGANLGREANLFEGRISWAGMFAALRASAGRQDQSGMDTRFLGTMEFYPEEGKYHLDGHRACGISLEPRESRQLGDICPVCGKPLTIGVLHRVMELADRDEPPADLLREPEARMLVPLPEIVAQIMGVGAGSRKVEEKCLGLVEELGPELAILTQIPEAEIRRRWEPLGEAVARIRAGKVALQPGFDGQYGVVGVFTPEELADLRGASGKLPLAAKSTPGKGAGEACQPRRLTPFARDRGKEAPMCFTPAQREAIKAGPGPVFVLAGPGSGKTRCLVARMERLLAEGAASDGILALTFTRRAAAEINERLALAFGPGASLPACDTLHGLAWSLLPAEGGARPHLLSESEAKRLFLKASEAQGKKEASRLWLESALALERLEEPAPDLRAALDAYARKKKEAGRNYMDYADLLAWLHEKAASFRGRWRHILVDEAQDLSPLQLDIIRGLLPADGAGFFGIGDPDQAIYGFRGAEGQSQESFAAIWPGLQTLRLDKSHRSSQKILDMSACLLGSPHCGRLEAVEKGPCETRIFRARDEAAEARWVADKIRGLIGAGSHSLMDGATVSLSAAPGEIAILTRLKAQFPPFLKALEKAGVPCQAPGAEEFWLDDQVAAFIDFARKPGAGENPEEILEKMAKAEDFVPELLAESEPFAELKRLWRKTGSRDSFFEMLAWLEEAEMISAKAQGVRLLTLHASKGLEFRAVFLPGLEDGLLPLRRESLRWGENGEDAAIEEERRLLYVGITRAARAVHISHCEKRMLYGRRLELAPSPFLAPLAAFCRKSEMKRHARRVEEEMSLFSLASPEKRQ